MRAFTLASYELLCGPYYPGGNNETDRGGKVWCWRWGGDSGVRGSFLGMVRAHHDYHGCGPRRVASRRLGTMLRTNACTPASHNVRSPCVITIRGGRILTQLTGVGTRVVKIASGPCCSTPACILIFTPSLTGGPIRSKDYMLRGVVLTTRTLKLNDY